VSYYDTTFCLGDFYASALLYRNDTFEGAPVMPLLLLVHERRTTESHDVMLNCLHRLTGLSTAMFVVNPEAAITLATVSMFQQATVV